MQHAFGEISGANYHSIYQCLGERERNESLENWIQSTSCRAGRHNYYLAVVQITSRISRERRSGAVL